ncbi:hypothetical protein [Allohahella sp. A8]|uniref:hypothetical protein n=1 Tax=Allohahella sp. A8 TaxID=3141461 RepID=UPI003A7F88AB
MCTHLLEGLAVQGLAHYKLQQRWIDRLVEVQFYWRVGFYQGRVCFGFDLEQRTRNAVGVDYTDAFSLSTPAESLGIDYAWREEFLSKEKPICPSSPEHSSSKREKKR